MAMTSILSTIIVVTNIGYVAAFDTDTKCPSWVVYDLEPHEVVTSKRCPLHFTPDPRIDETDLDADYRGSGYDRGHLAPAADFNWNTNALYETYYYSNICPQRPAVNRGKWLEIEKEIRALASSGTVHVVTFPYGFNSSNRIGCVIIPSKFIKIAYGYFGTRFYEIDN